MGSVITASKDIPPDVKSLCYLDAQNWMVGRLSM